MYRAAFKALKSRLSRLPSLPRPPDERGDRGMTLIEIIIVLSLVAGLMGMIFTSVASGNETAKGKQTELLFGQLRSSLQMYRMHNVKFPSQEQGLSALVDNPGIPSWRGPYSEPENLIDPWGSPIQYEIEANKVRFSSAGGDGEMGTADDIVWPAPKI